jgi:hypothetical protein
MSETATATPLFRQRLRSVAHLNRLGPGLITGAADDDPSGIATYSQAGAQFGFNMVWTMVLTYPLMTAVQLVSAQIGRVTGCGLAKIFSYVLRGQTVPYPRTVGRRILTGHDPAPSARWRLRLITDQRISWRPLSKQVPPPPATKLGGGN